MGVVKEVMKETELDARMRVLLSLIESVGDLGYFKRMPEGFFEDDRVRRRAFVDLPTHVQDLVLSVGLSTCFGVFADARSERIARDFQQDW